MKQAIEVAEDLVHRKQWTRDRFNRYKASCFKASLAHRVGGDLWAKLFMVCGFVDRRHVFHVNTHVEAAQQSRAEAEQTSSEC